MNTSHGIRVIRPWEQRVKVEADAKRLKKSYCVLVLWMSSTAPKNPMIMVAGRNIDGNSGVGTSHSRGNVTGTLFDTHIFLILLSYGIIWKSQDPEWIFG
jgi:hypothetical protein